jgi:hypothetical protein
MESGAETGLGWGGKSELAAHLLPALRSSLHSADIASSPTITSSGSAVRNPDGESCARVRASRAADAVGSSGADENALRAPPNLGDHCADESWDGCPVRKR